MAASHRCHTLAAALISCAALIGGVALSPPAAAAVTDIGVHTGNDTLTAYNTSFYRGRMVDRDCGWSVKLANGKVLWVFCDTSIYDQKKLPSTSWDWRPATTGDTFNGAPDPRMGGTAGIADPQVNPYALREGVSGAWKMPGSFLAPEHNDACVPIEGGKPAYEADWTKGLVAVPGTNSALVFYQTFCVKSDAAWDYFDAGVVTYNYIDETVTPIPTQSVAVGSAERHLFEKPATAPPAWSPYVSAPVIATVDGQQYLYTYRADQALGNVRVARVPFDGLADPRYKSAENYRYLQNGQWRSMTELGNDQSAPTTLLSGAPFVVDNISVAWYPQIGRYAMVYASAFDKVAVRTAPSPEGPWSAARQFTLPGCNSSGDGTCRAMIGHADTSTDLDLVVSFFHFDDQGTITTTNVGTKNPGRVRLATVPFAEIAPYATTVLDDDPLAYWRLGESGSTLADATGNPAGTLTAAASTAGVLAEDPGTSFDGTSSSALVPARSDLKLGGSFSIEVWAKDNTAAALPTGSYELVGSGNAGATAAGWRLAFNQSRKVTFRRDNLTFWFDQSNASLSSTAYGHFVVTYDAGTSTLKLYQNGSLKSSSSVTFQTPGWAATGAVTIASAPRANASVDEIALYGSALTSEQVTEHYSAHQL